MTVSARDVERARKREHANVVVDGALQSSSLARPLYLSPALFYLSIKKKKKKTASSSKSSSSSSLKPITIGACVMLAALQARHLWQERPQQQGQGQGQQQEGGAAAAK